MVMEKKKRLSVYSQEFWTNKGYSVEAADLERNKRRPIRKEYWMNKGYSEDESIKLAENTKHNNNNKGAKSSSLRKKEDVYLVSPRRKEYWMNKGYSEDESIIHVAKIQSTFSLEKCIKKYGLTEGPNIWKNRQIKWQNTINSKSQKEIDEINRRKKSININKYNSIEECIEYLNKNRKMTLVKTKDEFYSKIEKHIHEKPYLKYTNIKYYIKTYISDIQLEILDMKCPDEYLTSLFFVENKHLLTSGNKQAWRQRTEEGLLRSSYEIYFYEQIKEKFQNIELKIDQKYPNSNLRYDFNIFNDYIEICPLYGNIGQEKYTEKMDKKIKLFNSILLKTTIDIDNYIRIKNESRSV
jgi:hypothetical protein